MRAWQRMLSGRRLDLLDPAPVDIEIEDIAHGLARVARWNGQTSGEHAFSVAQHSLLVEQIAGQIGREMDTKWHLAILLHDAAEYVIGDMISPFKNALVQEGGVKNYKDFEGRLQEAIHIRFGLPASIDAELYKRIKEADRQAAWLEATQLAGFSRDEAVHIFGPEPETYNPMLLQPKLAAESKTLFLQRFYNLYKA